MYKETTKAQLLTEADRVKNFVLSQGYSKEQLIETANELKEKKEIITEIFWLDGADELYYPSFDSIKLKPRFVIIGKSIRAFTDGLIFPQDVPIILVFNNFNSLPPDEREKYIERICKKEDHDYYPHNYLHEESIVILGLGLNDDTPRISYKLEVRKLI